VTEKPLGTTYWRGPNSTGRSHHMSPQETARHPFVALDPPTQPSQTPQEPHQSFLKLSSSPRKSKPIQRDFANEQDGRDAFVAAMSGKTTSPLTELRDSYFPRLSWRNKKKGTSVRTAKTGEDRPRTPGILLYASAQTSDIRMYSPKRKFFGRIDQGEHHGSFANHQGGQTPQGQLVQLSLLVQAGDICDALFYHGCVQTLTSAGSIDYSPSH
jgi:hypothetical protein